MSVDGFEGPVPLSHENSGPAHKSYSYSMPRSMSANTLLSEGRVSRSGFALPPRYTVEPRLLTSRPAPVRMTKSASYAALATEYSNSAYRVGSLMPAPVALNADHSLSQFADPHPSQAQLQLADQQYNIRKSEWNRHVASQHAQTQAKLRSKYRIIQEQRRVASEANRRAHQMNSWIDGQKRIGYGTRPRTEHEFTPGTYTTLADVSSSNLLSSIQQKARQHRPPPQRSAPAAAAFPQQQQRPISAAGGGRVAAAVAAANASAAPSAPGHRTPPPAPAGTTRHRAPPPPPMSVDSISTAYLNEGSEHLSVVDGLAPFAHRAAPRMAPPPPPVAAHRPPPRPPPRPPREPPSPEQQFDGESIANAVKLQRLAKAEANEAQKRERLARLQTPELMKDLELISGVLQTKYSKLQDGFHNMKKSSGSDMSKSNSLRPEDFEKGIQRLGLPVPQQHIRGIAELMMNEQGQIELKDYGRVLKGIDYDTGVVARAMKA